MPTRADACAASPQVAAEAHADGLLSPAELRETVGELRGTYAATLAALGVDAASLPDPADSSDGGEGPYDDEYDDDEFYDAPGQARAFVSSPFFRCSLLPGFRFHSAWLLLTSRGAGARGAAAAGQRGVIHHAGVGLHGANQRHGDVAPGAAARAAAPLRPSRARARCRAARCCCARGAARACATGR